MGQYVRKEKGRIQHHIIVSFAVWLWLWLFSFMLSGVSFTTASFVRLRDFKM